MPTIIVRAPSPAPRWRRLVLGFCLAGVTGSGCTAAGSISDEPGAGGGPVAGNGMSAGRGGSAGRPGDRAGGGGGGPASAGSCGFDVVRLRELTPEQYTRTTQALLGTTSRRGDDLGEGRSQEADAALTDAHVAGLFEAARGLAVEATVDPGKLAPCLVSRAADATCVRPFLQDFTTRAFRRDVAPAEVDTYLAFFQKQTAAHDAKVALRLTVRVILASPDFVFRRELGPDGAKSGQLVRLTPHERASALSYFLTDGPPDAMLLGAAQAGTLDTKDQLAAQARRLLQSADSAVGLKRFFMERFRMPEVLAVGKDTKLFKEWVKEIPTDLHREAEAFVQHVLWQDGGKLETLLTANYGFVNGRLGTLYGLPAAMVPSKDVFTKLTLPGARAGILSTGAVMARLARIDDTAPVARGIFVREMALCQGVPAPPDDVNAVPPPPDGKRTQRQRLSQHTADPTCAACHGVFDPLGLAFETFDAIGRHRTNDVGQPIVTTGMLTAVASPAPFANAAELAQRLARAPETRACFATRMYAYAQGLGDLPADRSCVIDRLAAQLASSGGDLVGLAAAIVTDDSFLQRRVP